MEIDLSKRIIAIVDYEPNWKRIFDIEKIALSQAIGNNAIKIEHIGSTAVAGLAAKPIIDILIEVKSLKALDTVNREIAVLGYVIKGDNGISGRRYFQKGGHQRTHHVHAFQSNDMHLHRHRAFKEYLIAYPMIALEYGSIKKATAYKSNNDSNVYTALKNEFIQKHEKLALEWFNNEQEY